MFNPFPGLRSFEPGEDHLFFGREKEIDELLRRLRAARFLAVVGGSGSGKSSLIRSGLIPSLRGGFMAGASPDWRVAIMRPGAAPISALARALNANGVLGTTGDLATTNRVLIEATLLRGARGLIEAVHQARLPPGENLLVFVDQFEELFRFRKDVSIPGSRDEAAAFVKLLLEAADCTDFPIYVVLTMRADFIGDCMSIPGLPEAVNLGQFLVPRMTRDELRSAITGPVAVGGGRISGPLVTRLLNEFGDGYDKLPILQHALMRTWAHWESAGASGEIDLADYEAVGTSLHALSRHADEAFEEAATDQKKHLAEKIFKALTDTFTDQRGTRRPTSVADLALICEASTEDITDVVDIFRRPTRSFLMPPSEVELDPASVVDISHESLMWCWTRLATWAEEERASADVYARLSAAAQWYAKGRAGLWRNPELEVAQHWRSDNHPNAAWAARHNTLFAEAIAFLDASEAEWQRLSFETKRARQKKLVQARYLAAVFGCLFLVAVLLAAYSWRQRQRAEANLQVATQAVDDSLSAAGSEQAREGSDLPQMEQFRKQLLDKAQRFYQLIARQNPSASQLSIDQALAYSRLGDINRLLGRYPLAEQQYKQSIARLAQLSQQQPANLAPRRALAYSHNWLGETIRASLLASPSPAADRSAEADQEYTRAITLQRDLAAQQPSNATFGQELARSYYNRGVLRFTLGNFDGTKADFDQAIALLEPLIASHGMQPNDDSNPAPAQDLARAYNDYAILAGQNNNDAVAHTFYEKAIKLGEQLVKASPEDRDFQSELATYCSNEARMLADSPQPQQAEAPATQSLHLLQSLSSPTPSLAIRLVQALQLQGRLLTTSNPKGAMLLTQEAFTTAQRLDQNDQADHQLLSDIYMDVGANYMEIAQQYLRVRDLSGAHAAFDALTAVMPHLASDDRSRFLGPYGSLKTTLSAIR